MCTIESLGWSYNYGTFGASTGSVWMLGPKCVGSEENILDCDNYETYSTNSHSYDVGITCGELQGKERNSVCYNAIHYLLTYNIT